MAKSNHQRVGEAMEALSRGLGPYVDREMIAAVGSAWLDESAAVKAKSAGKSEARVSKTDSAFLLWVMVDHWTKVFGTTLGSSERNYVRELMDFRNRWAHQDPFSTEDTDRMLDSAHRLLQAISAGDEAAEVDRSKLELRRIRFEEQNRKGKSKPEDQMEGRGVAGLKPWREIVTPHPDVASGRYQQAEFAADLAQVHRGEGSDEYKDPREFFRRTYLTDGLKQLLIQAVQRVSRAGGAPIVELQTNFGGGKTHSLLALYHLFSGAGAADLPGIDSVLAEAGVADVPKANRAVLVGTALSPGQPHRKPDGTEIRTLWGELAWQLGGAEGFALIAEADATATNPGNTLGEVFRRFGPCLILIDEWVAYARQLYGKDDLPAGTFDTHFTFAQALTEQTRSTDGVLLVISIPASERPSPQGDVQMSEIEVGGEGGRAAIERLKNVIGRMESPWRPATTDESFEIVRRRLFQEMSDPKSFSDRDGVAKAFVEFYRSQSGDFPSECREGAYERRIVNAYPVHPELFDRLYEDWSSLARFQRTRGVLRLMAGVIHALWERQDMSPLIMPGHVPIDDSQVFPELTRYLEDNWKPVIEADVDGPQSLPREIDRDPNLGKYHACRRVARTIYIGSAPTSKGAHRGIEESRIWLGCVLPGEGRAIFGDALRRLSDRSTYLYLDGQRYWYSVNPSMTSVAKDRAAQRRADEVGEEIRVRLLKESRKRGDFAAVHAAPVAASDVPDTAEARLVILGPENAHSSKTAEGSAVSTATAILAERAGGPRHFRNMLVFLAPDRDRLAELQDAVRQYLAWWSIRDDADQLNLDSYSRKQVTEKAEQSDEVVDQRLYETFQWLLIPSQPNPKAEMTWEVVKVQGQEPLAVRASAKLAGQEALITRMGGVRLRHELDRIPLWRGDSVNVSQLWDDFAQYLYLPRLRDVSVLVSAIQEGVAIFTWEKDTFGYAEAWDESEGRYPGLRAAQQIGVVLDQQSVLVKAAVAATQLEKERPEIDVGTDINDEEDGEAPDLPQKLRRFHGSVALDPIRLGRDIDQIAEAIIAHLTALSGADVEVTLEINAEIPEGVPDDVVRTVTENAATLRFKIHGFERR